ncbi:activator-dependent family glycosyltransferase [Nonomuraea sp. NPDC051191]|uniref:activator-dependent family glycosyltransferase n=1 Tax=Nonomuraea sp. NPDC051191 TaxID=3364372 RepID=UPI00379CC8DD
MRVVITQIAATSHLCLTAPIGWALKAAGHDVVVATQPDLLNAVNNMGLTGVAVGKEARLAERMANLQPEETIHGTEYDITETRPHVLTYEYTRDTLAALASPLSLDLMVDDTMYDDLVAFCRHWRPDLVVWDSVTFSGPVAATVCGAAHVRTTCGLDHWARMRELFLRLRRDRPGAEDEDPVRDWVAAKLAKYGCDYDESVILGHATLDSVPSWLRYPTESAHLPMRYVAHNNPGAFPSWLSESIPDRPRVCLTMGVSLEEVWRAGATFALKDLYEAIVDLNVEVIVLSEPPFGDSVTAIPDNIKFAGFVPNNFLLKSCAAIIHHGGWGTTATAILNGVPQIIIPHSVYDAHQLAEGVATRGAGVHLPPDQVSAASLRRELQRVLEEQTFARSAAEIRQDMLSMPTPHDIVKDLDDLVSRHRQATPMR